MRRSLSIRNESLTAALRELERRGQIESLGRMGGWRLCGGGGPRFGGYRRGVQPTDIAGWQTAIYDPKKPTAEPKKGAAEKPAPGKGEKKNAKSKTGAGR